MDTKMQKRWHLSVKQKPMPSYHGTVQPIRATAKGRARGKASAKAKEKVRADRGIQVE